MDEVIEVLEHWGLNIAAVRERVYRAATPRERERWHAIWLLASGWPAAQVAVALERDPHTIGGWLTTLRQAGPAGLSFEHSGGSPPPSAPSSKPS